MKAKVKDLMHGDTVELNGGRKGTIVSCKPFSLVETAGGTTYEVTYKDGKETGVALLDGNTTLSLS
jgi:preprotein translocase subunit YajC